MVWRTKGEVCEDDWGFGESGGQIALLTVKLDLIEMVICKRKLGVGKVRLEDVSR